MKCVVASMLALTGISAGLAACSATTAVGSDREAALIAAHPSVAKRSGNQLILWPGTRYSQRLQNRSCARADTCIAYELEAVFSEGDLLGIGEAFYEGGGYKLIFREWGTLDVGEAPLPSPAGQHLLSVAWSDAHPPTNGLTLIRLKERMPRVIRRIPMDVLTAYEDIRWLNSDCITFSAALVADDGAYGIPQRYYLFASEPEWTLSSDIAPSCQSTLGHNALINVDVNVK